MIAGRVIVVGRARPPLVQCPAVFHLFVRSGDVKRCFDQYSSYRTPVCMFSESAGAGESDIHPFPYLETHRDTTGGSRLTNSQFVAFSDNETLLMWPCSGTHSLW